MSDLEEGNTEKQNSFRNDVNGNRDDDLLSAACENLSLINEQTPFYVEQKVAARNMKRQQEMFEIRENLAFYESKLDELQTEHNKAKLLTELAEDPCLWNSLSRDQKYDKQVILLLLNKSSYLISELQEEAWNQPGAFPKELVSDKQVMLARIKQRNFAKYYNANNKHSLLGNAGIPEEFLSDKEVLLDLIKVCPKVILLLRKHKVDLFKSMLMDDTDVFHAILKHHARTASKYLRQLSIRIRTNADLMVQAVVAMCTGFPTPSSKGATSSTSRGNSTTPPRASFVGKKLFHDKSFCLRVAEAVLKEFAVEDGNDDSFAAQQQRKGRRSCPLWLSDLPGLLKADKDVVLAFCRIKGRNLEHAALKSVSLSDNMDTIIEEACAEDPCAVIYAPSKCKARSQLLMSKDFVLHQALAKLEDDEEIFNFFEILPLKMKQDREIAAAAACKSTSLFVSLKNDWEKDQEFWCLLVHGGRGCWCSVPFEMRSDQDFALAFARQASGSRLISVVLEFPSLWDDRDVVRRMVTSVTAGAWEDVFGVLGPRDWMEDKDYCLDLLKIDGRLYEHVHTMLKDDRDIVKAALGLCDDKDGEADCYPFEVVRLLPYDVMCMHPELIAEAISSCECFDEDNEEDCEFPDFICDHLWAHREIALAWISKGGWWVDHFPDDFSDDKEIFLAFADHSPFSRDSFDYCSHTLISDKEFMLQVIKKHGCLLHVASGELQDDYDIMLAAYATDRELIQELDHDPDECESLMNFAKKVRKQLEAHTSFMTLLSGISYVETSSTCHLLLLNQGNETALVYKKLIADYVGLPLGGELRDLRRVSVDLTRWGY